MGKGRTVVSSAFGWRRWTGAVGMEREGSYRILRAEVDSLFRRGRGGTRVCDIDQWFPLCWRVHA